MCALTAAALPVAPAAAAADCRAAFVAAVDSAWLGEVGGIDAATPGDACTKELSSFSSAYQLVMSDEFGAEGRDLSVGGKDPLWTAERLYYFPTHDK